MNSYSRYVKIGLGTLLGEFMLTLPMRFSMGFGLIYSNLRIILWLVALLLVVVAGLWNMFSYIIRSSGQSEVRLGVLMSTLLPPAYFVFLVVYLNSLLASD